MITEIEFEESLNITDHIRDLVIRALNKYKTINEAMKALGIGQTRMKSLRDNFNLVKIDDQWLVATKQIKRYHDRIC